MASIENRDLLVQNDGVVMNNYLQDDNDHADILVHNDDHVDTLGYILKITAVTLSVLVVIGGATVAGWFAAPLLFSASWLVVYGGVVAMAGSAGLGVGALVGVGVAINESHLLENTSHNGEDCAESVGFTFGVGAVGAGIGAGCALAAPLILAMLALACAFFYAFAVGGH